MSLIHILDEPTINQIAAGEVVERPSAVVKELIENSVDSGASAITVEIKEGGLSLIRITDNGSGMEKEDIPLAFLRHATSKIRSAEDLLSITSLGFRGEALSSIAAVAQVELITKTPSALVGYRYLIEGGEQKQIEEIGCPNGTTLLVRNLFYNTPARRNFLKSAMTEAGYIGDLMERLMVSHPGVSFKYIVNNQVKLQSSGNNNNKDILYQIYGRDITKQLIPVNYDSEDIKINGFLGKPIINRGNRNYENYFINGRYIKSNIVTKAIEEAYRSFLMQHKYPFTSIYFTINPYLIDVNVHPQKMEIRLKNSEEIYKLIIDVLYNALSGKELIPGNVLTEDKKQSEKILGLPEPFEEKRRNQFVAEESHIKQKDNTSKGSTFGLKSIINSNLRSNNTITDISKPNHALADKIVKPNNSFVDNIVKSNNTFTDKIAKQNNFLDQEELLDALSQSDSVSMGVKKSLDQDNSGLISNYIGKNNDQRVTEQIHENSEYHTNLFSGMDKLKNLPEGKGQIDLFDSSKESMESVPFLSKKAFEGHRIIGQLFSTYWLIEYKKDLFIIDQHAAHEKILFERLMLALKNKSIHSQQLLPPIVLTLSLKEQTILKKYQDTLLTLGYEIEPFGGNEYSIRAVPADLFGLSEKQLFLEFIDELSEDYSGNAAGNTPLAILEKVASLSCKAAVKANHSLSSEEAAELIKELMTLENPYHCPHGRPVIISMSLYELEKKFKRIL